MSIKIGIRPIIDGRGKVRATLEEKTHNMAVAAKELTDMVRMNSPTPAAPIRRVRYA